MDYMEKIFAFYFKPNSEIEAYAHSGSSQKKGKLKLSEKLEETEHLRKKGKRLSKKTLN